MTQLLEILKEILHEIEKDNPYNLIGKGGTVLSLYYLNHRDSEDLDFDSSASSDKSKEIEQYFLNILDNLKKRSTLKDYRLLKSDLASTNRHHISLMLQTYKEFLTKIDIDFNKPTENLNKKGELFYYPLEKLFIGKSITFTRRKEFKDIYDVFHILHKIKIDSFIGNKDVEQLINEVISILENEDMLQLYQKAFRNREMKFKDFKLSQLNSFKSRLVKELRIFRNKIKKD